MGLVASNSEARRLIMQGGVRIDDEVVADADAELSPEKLRGAVLRVGKRKFLRMR